MKKRLTAVLMAVAMLVTLTAFYTPALSAEGETLAPFTDEALVEQAEQTEQSEQVQQSEQAEQTAAQDTESVEVHNYADFIPAIVQANDGDTIIIMGTIEIPPSTNITVGGKKLTFLRGTPEARFVFTYEENAFSSVIADFCFDGAELQADVPYIVVSHNAVFENVSFINCYGGNGAAVNVTHKNTVFTDCLFDNNRVILNGAHIFIDAGTANVTLNGCRLTNGYAEMKGGAIHNNATCSVNNTVITGNTAGDVGGGISSTGALTITDSKIYANTAKSGEDIANSIWGKLMLNDSLATMTAIFEVDGLVPLGWAHDYPAGIINTPCEVEAPQFIPLKMVFEDTSTPNPDPTPTPTPNPTPCPEPEKIIETVYVPYYIYVTEPAPSPTPTPTPEPTPEPTPTPEPLEKTQPQRLVCGNAVIDPLQREYLLGYVDSVEQGANIKRSQAATVIYRLLTADSLKKVYSETGRFLDVPSAERYAAFVNTLQNAGIVSGCGGDMFQPERNLTRAEMVTLYARFVEQRTDPPVQLEHWAAGAIQTAATLGWLHYDSDFNPDEEVTAQEFLDFTLTILNWAIS